MWPLLALCLTLGPAMALEVPTGCVEIRSRQIDRFLVATDKLHDPDRRHVGYDGTAQQWFIQHEAADFYRITHHALKEPLIESAQTFHGNYVFTWVPKQHVYNALWQIYRASDKTNYFIIKNLQYGHCLWTEGIGDWIGAYPKCEGHEFQWQIHKFDCK